MSAADYPRIAIVSANPIRGDQCNGMFMKSLFQGWPRERLVQIYFPKIVTWAPDPEVCTEYRTISVIGQVRRFEGTQIVKPQNNLFGRTSAKNGSSMFVRRTVSSIKRRVQLMNWLRPCAELWCAHFPLDRMLERQLRELRPDCVYALLGNYHLTKTIYLACSRQKLPLFTHVVDDFVTAFYQGMHFGTTLQTLSDSWFRIAVEYSSGLAAISPIMADEFAARYGRKWMWFTTGVDPNEYDPRPRQPDGTIRLVYAGHLWIERWQTLRALGLALKHLSEDAGSKFRLSVYAPEDQLSAYRAALTVDPIVELCGWTRPEELPRVFHNADILVHVESFDPTIARYTRLSFSTKLSQYMMAGRCILGVGPAGAGSLRMISQVGAGIATAEIQPAALANAIGPVIRNAFQQKALGAQGRQWALQWCDRAAAHERFRRELEIAARWSRSEGSSRQPVS